MFKPSPLSGLVISSVFIFTHISLPNFSLLTTAIAIESKTSIRQCDEIVELDGPQYWFYEITNGFKEINDPKSKRYEVYSNNPNKCIQVKLDEINNPESRTLGYKRALSEWAEIIDGYIHEGGGLEGFRSPLNWYVNIDVLVHKMKIQSLVGFTFYSFDDLSYWLRANYDNLYWSNEKQLLITNNNLSTSSVEMLRVLIHSYNCTICRWGR